MANNNPLTKVKTTGDTETPISIRIGNQAEVRMSEQEARELLNQLADALGEKGDKAYNAVHEEVMKARVKIWKMKDSPKHSIAEIDDIMADLCIKASEAALSKFEQSGPLVRANE